MQWLKEGHVYLEDKELKEMAVMAQHDLKSWLTICKERGGYNSDLEALVKSYQI